MGKPAGSGLAAGSSAPVSGHQNVDFDDLQKQLVELSVQDDGVTAMINLINETKKAKLSAEDRTIINIAGLITPHMMINKETDANVRKLKVTVDKSTVNVRQLAFHNERLEQYTRRDNLRLFNFPLCDDINLREKFIKLAGVLGVTVQDHDINIIHKLSSNARSQTVIVRMNNRKVRNDILFAKKGPLNTDESNFKRFFIQEDLTSQRSKLLKLLGE